MLPSPTDEANPVSRHLLRDWRYCAEELAGLEHIDGLGWHGLRRKFADEHRHVPLKDLADLGGWATARTILDWISTRCGRRLNGVGCSVRGPQVESN